jgi:hypothetical protein
MIAGAISRESTETVEDVQVILQPEDNSEETYYVTQLDGHYEFHNINADNQYEVSAARSGDYLNGVSTLDLVLIQKHILGLTSFDSPYKIIAADANNSETVSASDLVVLRKLILGLIEKLPQSESWRFVDASQSFEDIENPWPFTEVISINQLVDSNMNNDFVAVKIGDVNLDATPSSGFASTQIRSNSKLSFEISNELVNTSKEIRIPVRSSNFETMYGFQMTLNYDATIINSIRLEGAKLNLSNDHVATHNEMLTVSWNDSKAVSFTEEDVLFFIVMNVNAPALPNEILDISSDLTAAEAYTANYESIGVDLSFRASPLETVFNFELLQNRPNPFSNETIVEFVLPKAGKASVTVFDIAGKLLKEYSGEFVKGRNEILISASDLNQTHGVLYYQLEADGLRSTKKMILMY